MITIPLWSDSSEIHFFVPLNIEQSMTVLDAYSDHA